LTGTVRGRRIIQPQ